MQNSGIIVFHINKETFLFEGGHLSREQRIAIEAFASGAWEDYEQELDGKSNFEIIDWIVDWIKSDLGIELKTVGIDCEFIMNRP